MLILYSTISQEVPLTVYVLVNSHSILAKNAVCYEVVTTIELNNSCKVLIELTVYIVTIYTIYIFVKTCVTNCGIHRLAAVRKSDFFCKSLVALCVSSNYSNATRFDHLSSYNIFGSLL